MNKRINLFYLFLMIQGLLLNSCRNTNEKLIAAKDFDIKEFHSCINYHPDNSGNLKSINIDFLDAIDSGFIVPSVRQTENGQFLFSFEIRNKTNATAQFNWKIYYKNETYSFPENDSAKNINKYAEENFYGSYEDSSILFRTSAAIPADGLFHEITDSLRISGNPRHEITYFKDGKNLRWQRNLRVGNYSFLLIIATPETITTNNIPAYIQNICLKKNDHFITPYFYFQTGNGKSISNCISIISEDSLKVSARPDPGGGIYIGDAPFNSYPKVKDHSNQNICGDDNYLYNKSCFSQFLHYIDNSTRVENIPVISDVLNDNYSKEEYNWNRAFIPRNELISTTPSVATIPCETVYSDSINKKIIIHNPASKVGDWKKQNVGIETRHGFTYGKVRIKAKLTQLLNKNGMWNGLTNALWLISQSAENWNMRRPCEKEGYMATYWGGSNDKRVNRTTYSEIDFEILKTPSYCPSESFPPVYRNYFSNKNKIDSWNVPLPEEISNNNGNISVACTNWDMACQEPTQFGVGCNAINYNGKSFEAHRWDHTYRAITEKTPASDDQLFGSDFYYFEIDWLPEEIIWKIGPSADSMRVVGYMNNKVTSIPNNQMLLIITQEFHNTKWWPGSPYQQDNIPFPSKDIFGEIYEVVIE